MTCTDDIANPKAIRVLLIEDDQDCSTEVVHVLQSAGMHVHTAATGRAGLAMQQEHRPDVILVDMVLPDTDGVSLVVALTRHQQCGIIILSGFTSEADRIVGLEIGADDYIAKPPHPRELVARIRAVHRRVKTGATTPTRPSPTTWIGSCKVDLARRQVTRATGEPVALTHAEFAALEVLLDVRGEAVTRDRLCEVALHRRWRAEDRSVDQLIFMLRQKLSSGNEQYAIQTVRGSGYMLTEDHAKV